MVLKHAGRHVSLGASGSDVRGGEHATHVAWGTTGYKRGAVYGGTSHLAKAAQRQGVSFAMGRRYPGASRERQRLWGWGELARVRTFMGWCLSFVVMRSRLRCSSEAK